MRRRGWAAMGVLILGGCHAPPPDRAAETPTADYRIANPATDAPHLRVDPSSGALVLPFSVTLQGTCWREDAPARLGRYEIDNNFGTIEIDGAAREVLLHAFYPWEEIGCEVFQGLALADDHWYTLWFYASPDGLESEVIYFSGSDERGLDWEFAETEYALLTAPTTVEVSFPGLEVPFPDFATSFSIAGPEIQLDSTGPGRLTWDDRTMLVYPYLEVDCTSCPGGGAQELHTILWDPLEQQACFASLHLFPFGSAWGPRSTIVMHYTLCLPDLRTAPDGVRLDANWSDGAFEDVAPVQFVAPL